MIKNNSKNVKQVHENKLYPLNRDIRCSKLYRDGKNVTVSGTGNLEVNGGSLKENQFGHFTL